MLRKRIISTVMRRGYCGRKAISMSRNFCGILLFDRHRELQPLLYCKTYHCTSASLVRQGRHTSKAHRSHLNHGRLMEAVSRSRSRTPLRVKPFVMLRTLVSATYRWAHCSSWRIARHGCCARHMLYHSNFTGPKSISFWRTRQIGPHDSTSFRQMVASWLSR